MKNEVDSNRRHFLTVATSVTGGLGIAMAVVPFLSSLKPSARARALGMPVEVPLGSLEPGEMIRVIWRGKVIFVLRRTQEMLEHLQDLTDKLRDPASKVMQQQPEYAVNEFRSLKPEYLVVEGICTHFGCAPLAQFEVVPMEVMVRVLIFREEFIKEFQRQQIFVFLHIGIFKMISLL